MDRFITPEEINSDSEAKEFAEIVKNNGGELVAFERQALKNENSLGSVKVTIREPKKA